MRVNNNHKKIEKWRLEQSIKRTKTRRPDLFDAYENQLKEIMTELKWLTKESVLVGEKQLDTAENEYGALASKSGVFLESVFNNWRHSALISSSVHQMNSKEFHNGLMSHNELYKTLFYCNHRSHLLSYSSSVECSCACSAGNSYESSDEYGYCSQYGRENND